MINGHTDHPGLRAALEFEATRLGVPLRVRHTDLEWDASSSTDMLEVLIHESGKQTDFGLYLDGDVHRLSAPLWLPPDDTPIFGPLDEYGHNQPVASVLGHNVAIHVPPRALGSLALKALGSALEEALPLAKETFEREVLTKESERYVDLKASTWTTRIDQRRQQVRDAEFSVLRLEEDIRARYRNLAQLREELQLLESQTLPAVRRRSRDELERLRKMVPRGLQAVRLAGDRLVVTTLPIDIEHDGFTYQMGRYEVAIDIHRNVIRIQGLDRTVRGHCHPHVASGGEPCLGSMAGPVAHMLGEGDLFGVVIGLLQLLSSYNPSSPYVELAYWNPDYDDSARWDRCYEDAGPRECVTCGEEGCPYQDGASDRCWEYSDSYTTCIDCRDCDWANEAQDRCRDDHTVQECVECSTEACSYAGDADACFETHDGDECPDCEHTNCQHHPGEGEEEDE